MLLWSTSTEAFMPSHMFLYGNPILKKSTSTTYQSSLKLYMSQLLNFCLQNLFVPHLRFIFSTFNIKDTCFSLVIDFLMIFQHFNSVFAGRSGNAPLVVDFQSVVLWSTR